MGYALWVPAAPQMHTPMSPRKENKKEWRFSSALLFSCIFLLFCLPYYGNSRLFLLASPPIHQAPVIP